jgi:hypothetical protein
MEVSLLPNGLHSSTSTQVLVCISVVANNKYCRAHAWWLLIMRAAAEEMSET